MRKTAAARRAQHARAVSWRRTAWYDQGFGAGGRMCEWPFAAAESGSTVDAGTHGNALSNGNVLLAVPLKSQLARLVVENPANDAPDAVGYVRNQLSGKADLGADRELLLADVSKVRDKCLEVLAAITSSTVATQIITIPIPKKSKL
eukprot:6124507-Amphidinium_carterae.1